MTDSRSTAPARLPSPLLLELQKIRGNIMRSVERFTQPGPDRSGIVYVVGDGNTIGIGHDQNIGGQAMTTYEVKFGDHTSFSGNLAVAETINKSFNTITRSGASPELKEKLAALSKLVLELCEKLPQDKAEEAARDLKALTDEATSQSPRRKWYELSADGLIEAAKTVGEMAGPITGAVKAVLGFLS